MNTSITRKQALALLAKYNQEPFHLLHAFTLEGVMGWFAAGCSRDIIRQGAQMLNWELDDLFARTIEATKSCEKDVQEQMKAYGTA